MIVVLYCFTVWGILFCLFKKNPPYVQDPRLTGWIFVFSPFLLIVFVSTTLLVIISSPFSFFFERVGNFFEKESDEFS